MHVLRMKGRLKGMIPAILLVAVTGCGSGDSGNPVSVSDQYQQKVSMIGEIKDPEASATDDIAAARGPAAAVNNVFVNRVPYDGVSTDAPIFIAADQILSLGDATKQGILGTYRNGYPVILVRGNENQINALLEIVGLGTGYTLPENFSYAELFAVDADAGAKFTWSMFPPGASRADSVPDPFADNAIAQLDRARLFGDWVKQNGSRGPGLKLFTAAAKKPWPQTAPGISASRT